MDTPVKKTDFRIMSLHRRIAEQREAILNHSLYPKMTSLSEVRIFMEHHIYAVWDFMSLLKTLQKHLTSVDTAWVPTEDRASRKLINEIVMAEESDVDLNGDPASHYELYLDAMRQAGAETRPIIRFVQTLQRGYKAKEILRFNISEADEDCLDFLKTTHEIIHRGKLHEIAAAFTFGREDLIPDMFTALIKKLYAEHPDELSAFVYYLDRHIELDGDEHGPMAIQMMHHLCKEDDQKWLEAEEACVEALDARLKLWDAISQKLGVE
jgi:hypothetical protein